LQPRILARANLQNPNLDILAWPVEAAPGPERACISPGQVPITPQVSPWAAGAKQSPPFWPGRSLRGVGGCGWCGSASLLTPGTPAHYTQVMSGAKELLVSVAQAVTTGKGASSCDVVLVSLTESALTEAGKSGLGPSSLHGLFATFTRAGELRAAERQTGRLARR